jgi:subtilisin family serine protease
MLRWRVRGGCCSAAWATPYYVTTDKKTALHVVLHLLHVSHLLVKRLHLQTRQANTCTAAAAAADLPNVISVRSIGSNGARSSFSNYGASTVDLFAPGGLILSTWPINNYSTISGTSMVSCAVKHIFNFIYCCCLLLLLLLLLLLIIIVIIITYYYYYYLLLLLIQHLQLYQRH